LQDLAKEERTRIWNVKVMELLSAAKARNAMEQKALARVILEQKIKEFMDIHEGLFSFYSLFK
jgi:hypothetical protein